MRKSDLTMAHPTFQPWEPQSNSSCLLSPYGTSPSSGSRRQTGAPGKRTWEEARSVWGTICRAPLVRPSSQAAGALTGASSCTPLQGQTPACPRSPHGVQRGRVPRMAPGPHQPIPDPCMMGGVVLGMGQGPHQPVPDPCMTRGWFWGWDKVATILSWILAWQAGGDF